MASVPPGGFHFLEDTICVAQWPFNRPCFRYVLSMQVGVIINVTGYLDEQLDVFAAEKGIDLYHQFVEPPGALADLELWAKHTIELLLPLCARTTVLVLGSPKDRLEAVLAACLRRVQKWSLAPALSEFKYLTLGRNYFEQEQFIESFRAEAVALPLSKIPLFLQMHNAASDFENTLLGFKKNEVEDAGLSLDSVSSDDVSIFGGIASAAAAAAAAAGVTKDGGNGGGVSVRGRSSSDARLPSAVVAQRARLDTLLAAAQSDSDLAQRLHELLRPHPTGALITKGVTYDPTLSLVNDKDDDD